MPDGAGLALTSFRVTNAGNGNTQVLFEVGTSSPELAVSAPRPVVLARSEAGGGSARSMVDLRVQRIVPGDAPAPFSLRYRATYALDASLVGEQGELAFHVLPLGGPQDPQKPGQNERTVPAGAVLLAGAGMAVAARLRRK